MEADAREVGAGDDLEEVKVSALGPAGRRGGAEADRVADVDTGRRWQEAAMLEVEDDPGDRPGGEQFCEEALQGVDGEGVDESDGDGRFVVAQAAVHQFCGNGTLAFVGAVA